MSAHASHRRCQNCEAPLAGPFCHQCGQHDFDVSRSFHHVFLEALENFFHFDAKFFRNVVALLFQPGALSADYNAGKRASQMPPFRLYLFISVLFFFSGFLSGRPMIRLAESPLRHDNAVSATAVPKSAEDSRPSANGATHSLPHEANSRPANGSFWGTKLEHFSQHPEETIAELGHAFPKILIFCLPAFALYTRWLFRADNQHYLQHLVVAVHFHTFIFLWKLTGDGWVELCKLGSDRLAAVAAAAVAGWFILYPLLMFRRLFGQPWLQTLLKTLALFVLYWITLVACFLAAVAALLFLQ